jgi:hypothetical protein
MHEYRAVPALQPMLLGMGATAWTVFTLAQSACQRYSLETLTTNTLLELLPAQQQQWPSKHATRCAFSLCGGYRHTQKQTCYCLVCIPVGTWQRTRPPSRGH